MQVNVDIDVPLFLPLYGQRRLYDLRKIAWRERNENFKIDGQMNFDSGWEWGYWLSDVVTARASWDPLLSDNITDPNYNPKQDEWSAFKKALYPFAKIFENDKLADKLTSIIVELSKAQAELLIYGSIGGIESNLDLKKYSGIPYLSGDDTWIDLPRMFGLHLFQPDKIHLQEVNSTNWEILSKLLSEMDYVFGNFSSRLQNLYFETYCMNEDSVCFDTVNSSSQLLFQELVDSLELLSLRAKQVHKLYESKHAKLTNEHGLRATLLTEARNIIYSAEKIVSRRESHYRVPWQRIGGWRDNPTVYRFGYLWAVHSLYYWWRDQGIAEGGIDQSEYSPCYLNRIDATEVAVGYGKSLFVKVRELISKYSPFSFGYPLELSNCIAPPPEEYVFPRDLF